MNIKNLPTWWIQVKSSGFTWGGLFKRIRDFGNTAIKTRTPWFNYDAIDFLKSYITKGMTVLEFGSGGSTLFFSDHCKSVVSIEEEENLTNHIKWIKYVKKNLHKNNVRFLSYGSNIIGKYDIVLIDGTDQRLKSAKLSYNLLKPNGIMIIDDIYSLYPEPTKAFDLLKDKFKSYQIFKGFKLESNYCWQTAVLFK
jgi:hypothetical protein